jgi:hypothetical protein
MSWRVKALYEPWESALASVVSRSTGAVMMMSPQKSPACVTHSECTRHSEKSARVQWRVQGHCL